MMKKFLQSVDWVTVAGAGGLIALVTIAAIGDEANVDRKRIADTISQQSRLNTESQIAISSWDKCNFVKLSTRDAEGNTYFGRLYEGEPVLDDVTRKPLPDNTVVCSEYGDLGTMVDGRVTNVIVNQEVERKSLEAIRTNQEVQ